MQQYGTARKLSYRVGLGAHLVSRITGTIFILGGSQECPGKNKTNIGLNLKFTKKEEEVRTVFLFRSFGLRTPRSMPP